MPRGAKVKSNLLADQKVTISYYGIEDVMVILGCCRTKAQDVVRQLNDELEAKGFMRYSQGKVPKRYFHERFYL